MNGSAEHHPLPWSLKGGGYYRQIIDANGEQVAERIAPRTAEWIVKVANAKALKTAERQE